MPMNSKMGDCNSPLKRFVSDRGRVIRHEPDGRQSSRFLGAGLPALGDLSIGPFNGHDKGTAFVLLWGLVSEVFHMAVWYSCIIVDGELACSAFWGPPPPSTILHATKEILGCSCALIAPPHHANNSLYFAHWISIYNLCHTSSSLT